MRKSVELDVSLIDHYDRQLPELERYIESSAHGHDPVALALLRTVPGLGEILGLSILYEIERIERFPRVQDFLSYGRLVKPTQESAGKILGHSGRKIGNAHLKWAFSEVAVCFLRGIGAPRRCARDWLPSTARARACRSSPHGSPVRCTSCSSEERRLMPSASSRIPVRQGRRA